MPTLRAGGIAVLLASALGACGGPPWTLSQSPTEISLRWYPDTTSSAAADTIAQQHCQSSGRKAELVSSTQDGSAQLATYRCR